MTREDAILCLKGIKNYGRDTFTKQTQTDWQESLDMAIKALKQEKQELKQESYENFESTKDHIYKLAGDYKCWDNRLTQDEALELCHILEQETKMGNWIAKDIHNCHTSFECSKCGYTHSFIHLYGKPTADYTYCPNCGAKMESEE